MQNNPNRSSECTAEPTLLCMNLNPFNFCIYHINIAFIVDKDVTRYKIPYLIQIVPKTSYFTCFLKHNRGTVLLLSCCDNERTVPVYVPKS